MNVEDIVKTWLKENGYDGLCDPEIECGCSIDDFAPCGEIWHGCQAAHQEKAPIGSDIDYLMYPGKANQQINSDRATECQECGCISNHRVDCSHFVI